MKSTISQEQINDTAVRLGIPTIPFFQRRIARAYDLVETSKVNEISHDDVESHGEAEASPVCSIYRVRSQYDPKAIYTVELNHGNPHCTCPDNERTIFCKHSIASMMVTKERERKASVLIVKETAHTELVKASWVVTDGTLYTNVWQDLNGKVCCVCGAYYKRDCIHKQSIREYYSGGNNGNGSKIVNDCGTSEAKALQEKLNGSNGTGDNQTPVHHQLNTSDPFQEAEQLDIDQINGNGWRVRRDDKPSRHALGDLVHVLSNREYVISYRGIMKLAEKHGVTFDQHTDEQEAKDTRTVIAYARCGNNTRASGKPMNGSFEIAVALARRNACRQLLPLPEIKALEHKAKLEAEFDWQKAKAKCLKIVPDFKLDILIHDLVKAGTLRQAHPSDYNRKEWLMIHNAVKKDAEINGNDDGGGKPLPSDKFTECRDTAKDFIRYSWLKDAMLKSGEVSGDWTDDDIAKLKEACEVDASLFGKELGHFEIEIQPNRGKWAYQRRWSFLLTPMSKRCFWCGETKGTMPDTFIDWGRYEIKTSLCMRCSRKAGNGELDKSILVKKFDDLYHVESHWRHTVKPQRFHLCAPSPKAEPVRSIETVPSTEAEFVERCKQAEKESADDTTDDANDAPLENENGAGGLGTDGTAVRKLVMGKDRQVWLVEKDGTRKAITFAEAGDLKGNSVLRLTQAIACGADIGVVEL